MLAIACFDARDIETYEKDLNDIQTKLTNAAIEYATSYEASLQQLQHGVTKADEDTGVRMQNRLDLGLTQGSVQQNSDIVKAMAGEEGIEDLESNASTNTEGALSQARKIAKQVPGEDVLSQLVKLRKNAE